MANLWLLLWVAGCTGPTPGDEAFEVGPMASFESEVQPALSERCASGGCHGVAARPLALYAPGVLRMDGERTYLDEALTADELEANAHRLAGFAHGHGRGDMTDSPALCKPLSQSAGGCWHGADDVFFDRTDPDYQAMVRWLQMRSPLDGGLP